MGYHKENEINERARVFSSAPFFCGTVAAAAYLLIHGYRFMNKAFAGDALLMIYQNDAAWQIALGRFVQPVLIMLRGSMENPLLIGLLTAFWLGAAAWLMADIFRLQSRRSLILTAVLMAGSNVFTAANSGFLPWSDFYGLALFLALLSVWLIQKEKWYFCLAGALCLTVSMGIYQAYVCVAAGAVIMLLIRDVLEARPAKETVSRGLRLGISFLLGALVYVAVWKVFQKAFGIWTADTYNGLAGVGDYTDTSIAGLLGLTYQNVWDFFADPVVFVTMEFRKMDLSIAWVWILRICNALAALLLVVGILRNWRRQNTASFSKPLRLVLLALLLLVFPFAINVVCFISKGMEHTLMTYAYVLPYLLCVILWDRDGEKAAEKRKADRIFRGIMIPVLGLIVWNQAVYASQVYLKRDLQDAQAQSLMTRMVYGVESMEGYEAGVTPVAFCGSFETTDYIQPIESMAALTPWGMGKSALTYVGTDYAYLTMVLNVHMNLVRVDAEDERIKDMPCYPAEGSIDWVGDTLVVKVSEF